MFSARYTSDTFGDSSPETQIIDAGLANVPTGNAVAEGHLDTIERCVRELMRDAPSLKFNSKGAESRRLLLAFVAHMRADLATTPPLAIHLIQSMWREHALAYQSRINFGFVYALRPEVDTSTHTHYCSVRRAIHASFLWGNSDSQ